VNAGKTISIEKARADFGALLRLAERFGSVRIMHGSRLLGEVLSAARSQRLAELEPLPQAVMEKCLAAEAKEHAETLQLAQAQVARLAGRALPKPAKKKPGQ
jgi:hypothetical protein